MALLNPRSPFSRFLSLTLALTVTSFSVMTSGCHRQYYRKQADCEVNALIDQKASHVARPPNVPIRVDVDRRSRMFNPFDLDFQPMPLDDPTAYTYMQCVDGRRGYPMWEAAGFTNTAQNPDWWQFLPLDDDGVLVLNSENAVRIALLHSPDYQRQVEQLYFAALNVSAERFFFDTQFFGGADAFFTTDGPLRGGAGGSSTTFSLGADSVGPRDLSLRRRLATGGELIVGLANNIVWELSGPNAQSASTVLDFSLVQPLLRNAGRDVVLENLTQSERQLLYAVRQFERYRRNFYLNVVVGRGIESNVQTNTTSVNISGRAFTNARGFLSLLQTKLQIRNSEENIARQTENLLILEDTLVELLTTIPDDAEQIVRQRLQVAQARQSLLRSQQNLVSQQAGYQADLDNFLTTLGLPPYICVRVDDPILEGFELIDRDLLTRREVLSALRADVGGLNVSILDSAEFVLDPDTGLPVAQIEWSPQVREWLEQLREQLLPLTDFTEELIEKDLPNVREDIDRLAEAVPERKSATEGLEELYKTEKESICGLLNISEIDEAIFEVDQLDGLSGELVTAYAKLIERLLGSEEAKQIPEIAEALVRAREAEGNVEEPEEDLPGYQRRLASLEAAFQSLLEGNPETIDPRELALTLRDDIILASQDLVAELGDDILALQLIQARARTESVVLPEIDISPETAFEIARQNRRDWANARAVLVDAWRNIEVVADDLESTLDLTFSGDVQNFGDNPLDLRSRTGRLRVGLQWDAPITRLLERNAYRRALIQYEQARRSYYVFVDTVWQLLRDEVRQLEVNRFNFELGRQSVRIAAQQIELNADIRALNDARGRSSGPTAARDAISALSDLLQAQNGLLNIFVNYEVVRRSLDFDLGTMELTPAGLWIDPGELQPEYLMGLPGTFGGGLIGCGCYDCGFQCHPIPVEPRFDDLLESLPEPAVQNPVDVIDEAYNEATMPVDPGPIDAIPSPEDTVDEIPSPSDAPPAPQLELPADDSLPALEPLPPPQLTPPAEDE